MKYFSLYFLAVIAGRLLILVGFPVVASRSQSKAPTYFDPKRPSRRPAQPPVDTPTYDRITRLMSRWWYDFFNNKKSKTRRPTPAPTLNPSTLQPTVAKDVDSHAPVTSIPSSGPSPQKTDRPSILPSYIPSSNPSSNPTELPSHESSRSPSIKPSEIPSISHTNKPSIYPSTASSSLLSTLPSTSHIPSPFPSDAPTRSNFPSSTPTLDPSREPTSDPSPSPSNSHDPTSDPTAAPSNSDLPTFMPSDSSSTSHHPSFRPTADPSESLNPTGKPSEASKPTSYPSSVPSNSNSPSSEPSVRPSSSHDPSTEPSMSPSPSSMPSNQPTPEASSDQPTIERTLTPTLELTNEPYQVVSGFIHLALTMDALNITYNGTITDELEEVTLKYLQENIGGENRFGVTNVSISEIARSSETANYGSNDMVTSTVFKMNMTYEIKERFIWWIEEESNLFNRDLIEVRQLDNVDDKCSPKSYVKCCTTGVLNSIDKPSRSCKKKGCSKNRCLRKTREKRRELCSTDGRELVVNDDFFGKDFLDVLRSYTAIKPNASTCVLDAINTTQVASCATNRYIDDKSDSPFFYCNIYAYHDCENNEDILFGNETACHTQMPSAAPSNSPSTRPTESARPSASNSPSTLPSVAPSETSSIEDSNTSAEPSQIPSEPPSTQPTEESSIGNSCLRSVSFHGPTLYGRHYLVGMHDQTAVLGWTNYPANSYIRIFNYVDSRFDAVATIEYSGSTACVAVHESVIAIIDGNTSPRTLKIFERDSIGEWNMIENIMPEASAYFGCPIDLDVDSLVARDQSDGGKVLVFERSNSGWLQSKTLKPDDSDLRSFGSSLSLQGKMIVIADPLYASNPVPTSRGAFFTYEYDLELGDWELTQGPIFASQCFGLGDDIAIWNENGLLVGCRNDEGYEDRWSVYFYKRSSTENKFRVHQVFRAIDQGTSLKGVKVHEDTMIVQAGVGGSNNYILYIFTLEDEIWKEAAKILPPENISYFGRNFAVSGNTAMISSEDRPFSYAFGLCLGSTMSPTSSPTTNTDICTSFIGRPFDFVGDYFTLASHGNTAVLASHGSGGSNVTVYDYADGKFEQGVVIFDGYAPSVSIHSDVIAVTDHWEKTVHIFQKVLQPEPTWLQSATIQPEDVDNDSRFGLHVETDSNVMVISAPYDRDRKGSVLVFRRSGTNWQKEAKLAPFVAQVGEEMRVSVAGDLIALGSAWNGIVYIYEYDSSDGVWRQLDDLVNDHCMGWFGDSISITVDRILAGCKSDSAGLGAVYFYNRVQRVEGTDFELKQKIKWSNELGWSLGSLSSYGDIMGVGAAADDGGNVWIFLNDDGFWSETARIDSPSGVNWFGLNDVTFLANDKFLISSRDDVFLYSIVAPCDRSTNSDIV